MRRLDGLLSSAGSPKRSCSWMQATSDVQWAANRLLSTVPPRIGSRRSAGNEALRKRG